MWTKLQGLLAAAVVGSVLSTAAADPEPAKMTVRTAPDWLRNAVIYEIYPRNFSAAGDFNGITARLDDLQNLGVDVLWLMPIHPVGQKLRKGTLGSPYSIRDFYGINPDYGTTNDFRRLIQEAHARKMKVILDIVAGHTAWDSVLMAHPEYYQTNASGQIVPPNSEWPDVAGLNYENPELRNYMINMLAWWLQQYNLDGFRCDVAYTVPVEFWRTAREQLEKVNPNVIILAEAGARPALLTKAFDMDSSWSLYSWLGQVMAGEAPAVKLRESWDHTRDQFPDGAMHLRYSDIHHQPRAVVRYGVNGALATQVFMLTLDGVPLFYNGMEVGDSTESADPALFEKMPIFWTPGQRPPLRDIYRDLIQLRKQHPAFTGNDLTWIDNQAPSEVVSYTRKDKKDEYLVVINFSSRHVDTTIGLPDPEGFEPVKITGMPPLLNNTLPDVHLPGYGWQIYHRTLAK
ncbi:MAG: alpha-amylase family glycosyl hydrolase [Verrucomicrobiota bacterium]